MYVGVHLVTWRDKNQWQSMAIRRPKKLILIDALQSIFIYFHISSVRNMVASNYILVALQAVVLNPSYQLPRLSKSHSDQVSCHFPGITDKKKVINLTANNSQ